LKKGQKHLRFKELEGDLIMKRFFTFVLTAILFITITSCALGSGGDTIYNRSSYSNISLSHSVIDFGIPWVGYNQLMERVITVTNTSDESVTLADIKVLPGSSGTTGLSGNAGHWILVQDEEWSVPMAPGDTRAFTARPINGLPMWDYSIGIDISEIGYSEPGVILRLLFTVTERHYAIPGDVNGAGILTGADVLRFRLFLAGHDVEIDRRAADVNLDGEINTADLNLIRAFRARYPVTLLGSEDTPPTEPPVISNNTPIRISATSQNARQGELVDIVVSLNENPGVTLLELKLDYARDTLELVGITQGAVMDLPEKPARDANPMPLNFELTSPFGITRATGNLVNLRFRVRENAPHGMTVIRLDVANAFMADRYNYVPVAANTVNGSVIITE
jgi:hypothetical protein